MGDFEGLGVVVTGAAGGIGRAMCETFAAAGARVALVDVNDASALARDLGPMHRAWQLDLGDPAAIARTLPEIGAAMEIDVLINNAGIGIVFPAEQPRLEDWETTLAINLRAPWLVAQAALPWLKRSGRGRVVNISSQAGVVAIADHLAYGASKAGLNMVTKVLALEWAGFGITVNAIAPTVVETPMALVGWAGEKGVRARAEIPVGRFARPAEIAAAARYLASTEAAIITGEVLMADGGFTMR